MVGVERKLLAVLLLAAQAMEAFDAGTRCACRAAIRWWRRQVNWARGGSGGKRLAGAEQGGDGDAVLGGGVRGGIGSLVRHGQTPGKEGSKSG
jgi:hypothetical protein